MPLAMVAPSRVYRWFAAALLISAMSLSGTDATAECSCQPSEYTFKLNFEGTCQESTVDHSSDAIAMTSCDLFSGSEEDKLVRVNSILITELPYEASFDYGNAKNGDEFTYRVQNGGQNELQIQINGVYWVDEFGEFEEELEMGIIIVFHGFNAECQGTEAMAQGQTIGWLEVVNVEPPPSNCELPSASPSEVPSTAPSSPPSGIPSSTPTDLPSESPSAIPSAIPSSTLPSEAPSMPPSEAPTAPPSVDFCGGGADKPTFHVGEKYRKDCKWIAKYPEKRCHLDNKAFKKCPSVCNPTCNKKICKNDSDFRANKEDHRDCDWIAKSPHTRCLKDEDALYKCPSVCSPICTGNCQKSAHYQYKGKPSKTCGWVADKPDKRCSYDSDIDPDNDPFVHCSGVCNPFCGEDFFQF